MQIACFLDFTACFDTVGQNILILKLYRCGIRGVALNLIKSYFADRNKKVHTKKFVYDIGTRSFGDIQGSKSGPLFFENYTKLFKLYLRKQCRGLFDRASAPHAVGPGSNTVSAAATKHLRWYRLIPLARRSALKVLKTTMKH